MAIEFAIEELNESVGGVSLKVIGIGGAGGNAVNSMISSEELRYAKFIVANTDAQALTMSPADYKVQLGKKITKGLGAGSNPDIGRRAAEEDLDAIIDLLADTDILFVTAGLGGGTGSGALPVIAHAAKELGILTIAIVTKPFTFEGKRRAKHADDVLKTLKSNVDTLIVVPNQRLLETSDPKISMLNAFALSNDVLKQAIKGISDIITKAGHVNVDFADVRTIMKDTGLAIMGTGRASGNDRARQAALRAINSPLIENATIKGAKGVLINITGNEDLELQEINEAASMVYDLVSPEANIILGSVIDSSMANEVSVTVIATGLEDAQQTIAPSSTIQQEQTVSPAKIADSATQKTTIVTETITKPNIVNLTSHESTNIRAAEHASDESKVDLPADQKDYDLESLDTPTFMRKKAEGSNDVKN